MRKLTGLAMLLMLSAAASAAPQGRETPYWASIAAGEALMRTGPGRNYPAIWLYRRADLPIKVIETYPSWRKVQDPDGTTGWMLVNLLSDARTGIVTGSEPRPIRKASDAAAAVVYLAQPGVVGRIARCGGGWCRIVIGDRSGFIAMAHIWGVDPSETLP